MSETSKHTIAGDEIEANARFIGATPNMEHAGDAMYTVLTAFVSREGNDQLTSSARLACEAWRRAIAKTEVPKRGVEGKEAKP